MVPPSTLTVTITDAIAAPLFLGHLLAILICLCILWFAVTHRDFPGALTFSLWLAATGAWMGLHTIGLLVADPGYRLVVDSLALAAVPLGALAWLFFSLTYSGRWHWRPSIGPLSLVAASVVASALVATNPLHGLVLSDFAVELSYGVAVLSNHSQGPGFTFAIGFTYVLYLIGIGVLVDLAVSTNRLYRDQVLALVLAVALPLSVATVVIVDVYDLPWNPTPVSFGLAAIPLGYAVFRSQLLQFVPASFRLGERKAVETLDQGVLVLDPDGRVVFANSSLGAVLRVSPNEVVGRDVLELLEASPLVAAADWAVDERTRQQADGGSTDRETDAGVPRTLQHPATGLTYEVIESQIEDPTGPELGRTLFFRDVTEERRRKQRLLVLNRVVRHNLRNDMNVLRGHVRLLEEVTDDESVDVIEEIASDLIGLGEKAHEMDRIIQEASHEPSHVNVAGIVDRVVARYAEDAVVEVDSPTQAWVESHGPVVEAIVSNLVENAVRHSVPAESTAGDGRSTPGPGAELLGDGEDVPAEGRPVVEVGVTVTDDVVTLSISDDGPGIPEQEIATLVSGEISALQHGSGLGLWMVKWCVDLTNADWEIDTDDGTCVTVTFTRHRERRDVESAVAPAE